MPTASLIPANALGNTVVVDLVNGDDTHAQRGSLALPFATIAAALAVALAGDTVLVLPGTYVLTAGLVIPTGVSLRSADARRTVLSYTGVGPFTLVTIGQRDLLDGFDLTINATSGIVTGILINHTSGVAFRINSNPNSTGNIIACEYSGVGVANVGKSRLLLCALLGFGTGEALRVSGTGESLISRCNLDGIGASAAGVRLSAGTTTFETTKIGGTIGLQVLSGATCALASNVSVSVYDVQAGGTLVSDAESFPRNRATTTDPTVDDDISVGYDIGSRWTNTASQNVFICVDSTPGAAEWAFLRTSHEQRLEFSSENGASFVVLDQLDGFEMPDGNTDKGGHSSKIVPGEVDLTSDPIVKFDLFVFGTGSGDGTVELRIRVKNIGDGELSSKAFDQDFTLNVAITNTLRRRHHVTIALDRTLMAPLDNQVLVITRNGTAPADTYTGSVMLASVALLEFGEQ